MLLCSITFSWKIYVSISTHLTNYQMYVMHLDTALYVCGTGHHQGRHDKIQLYHNHLR